MYSKYERELYYHSRIYFDMETVNVLEEGITSSELKKLLKSLKNLIQ